MFREAHTLTLRFELCLVEPLHPNPGADGLGVDLQSLGVIRPGRGRIAKKFLREVGRASRFG